MSKTTNGTTAGWRISRKEQRSHAVPILGGGGRASLIDITPPGGTFDFVYGSSVTDHTPSVFYNRQRWVASSERYSTLGSLVPETLRRSSV
jgi:hypothetical protein